MDEVNRSAPQAASAAAAQASESSSTALYWPLQLIGWGAQFWSQASGEVIFARVPWSHAAALWGAICLTGIGLTHLLRLHAKRHRWVSLPPKALVVRAASSVILIGLIHYAMTLALSTAIYGDPVPPISNALYHNLPHHERLLNVFLYQTSVLLTWVAIYLWITSQRQKYRVELRQAQLSEALRAAQLRLLVSQLNPHFLFNSLNGVRALIADEPAKAQDAVTHLARTLRYTLTGSDEDLVTLARELEMVADYLALEGLRLAERLTVVREIEPGAADVRIPVMLVQTLVENAIKHGIAPLKQGGTLRLTARIEKQHLLVRVENPRAAGSSRATTGIGLRNSSERLRLLYGPAASLHLDLSDATHAVAQVRLPL
jgi:two-component system sensor histidine kinase AlgZ